LFIGIDSEIEREGECGGEGNNNEMWHMWLGWLRLIYNLHNLKCIIIYDVDCAWEILHFVQIVYLTVTVQFKRFIYTKPQTNSLPPLKSNTVLSQCDTCHWHLKAAEHIYWCVVSSSSQLTADRWSAVMLKANKTAIVQDLCRCR
jgi:hypothetical protein